MLRKRSVSAAPMPTPKKMPGLAACPHCGDKLWVSAKVCNKCGQPVGDQLKKEAETLQRTSEVQRRATLVGGRRITMSRAAPSSGLTSAASPAKHESARRRGLTGVAVGANVGGGGEVPAGADECVYCLREIAFGAEFCPLAPEASRQADGPKVHPQCWDLFFADTSRARCEWCCRVVQSAGDSNGAKQWHDGSQAAGRAPLANVPGGGAAGPLHGKGRRVLHQECVDDFNKARGMACAHCGKTVHVGLRVEGRGLVHKGFCFNMLSKQLAIEEKKALEALAKAEAEDFTCAECKQLIAPEEEFYTVNANGEIVDDEGGTDGGKRAKVHVGCLKQTHQCAHCGEVIALDSEFYESEGGAMLHVGCWEGWTAERAPRCAQCGQAVVGEHYVDGGQQLHLDCWKEWRATQRQARLEAKAAAKEEAAAVIIGAARVYSAKLLQEKAAAATADEVAAAAAALAQASLETSLAAEEEIDNMDEDEGDAVAETMHEVQVVEVEAAAQDTSALRRLSAVDVGDAAVDRSNAELGWMLKMPTSGKGLGLGRSWKRRWAEVKHGLFCYYGDAHGKAFKGAMPLDGCTVRMVDVKKTPHGPACGFVLVKGTRTMLAYPEVSGGGGGSSKGGKGGGATRAATRADVAPWVLTLKECIEEADRVAEGPQELLSKRRASQAALGQGAVGFSEKE